MTPPPPVVPVVVGVVPAQAKSRSPHIHAPNERKCFIEAYYAKSLTLCVRVMATFMNNRREEGEEKSVMLDKSQRLKQAA